MARFSTLLALCTVVAVPALGQDDTSPIPRELASALIAGGMMENVRVFVGRPPDGFPRDIVPSNARVLGGIAHGSAGSPMQGMATILVVPESRDTATAMIGKSLEGLGWATAAMPGPQRGGFVLGPVADFSFLCRDSTSLRITATARAAGGSLVHLTTQPARDTMCDPDRMARMSRITRGDFDDFQLPLLRPPVGVYARGGSSGGGNNSRGSNTELATNMRAADLGAHFNNQLREQGWSLGTRASDDNVFIQTATRTDAGGRTLVGVLGVVATPNSDTRHVWIRVVRPNARR